MRFERIIFLFLLTALPTARFFSLNELDSLKLILKTAKDGEKVKILNALCDRYVYLSPDSSLRYGKKGLDLAKKTGNLQYEAAILTNIGNAYIQKGDYSKSLDHYIEAEKKYELVKDTKGKIQTIINIGFVYELQNLFDKALANYQTALKIAEETGDSDLKAQVYIHLGVVNYAQKNKDIALEYFKRALKISQQVNNVPRIMECLNNIAVIYQEMGKYEEALQNFRTDLKYAERSGIKSDVIAILHNIALVYRDGKKYNEAVRYLDSSRVLAKSIRDFEKLQEIYSSLSGIYRKQNDAERTYEYFQLSVDARDSLLSQTQNMQFAEMSTKYDTEKKEAENKLLKTEGEKQRAITFGIAIGLALVVLLAYFVYRNFKVQQRANIQLEQQNTEIKEQKHIIEDKQKEILDSIAYAKKLQEAILPPVNLLKETLDKIFLFYQPKDIVAGDFYWMETVGTKNKEQVLIAAADSTGHGVPGAMVSVVCSNALNRTVNEFKITEPGEILGKARDLVLETFSKSERDVKDGMDISLLSIARNRDGDKATIKWAGANNPIYILSNNEVSEVRGNKFAVGAYATQEKENFTTHSIELKKGDRIYLFTDGMADQFGGPKGKKYKYKRMQQKMIESCTMAIEEQKEFLRKDLLDWQGSLEQVDDILVIGIEV